MLFEKDKIYVHNKNKEIIAVFDKDGQGLSPEQSRNMMVGPRVRIEQNGESTLTFQMDAMSEKWHTIRDPENLYYVNGRWYTPLNEGSYQYTGEGSARLVNVTCVETWYLLGRQYHQVYCCGLYVYAKATFQGWVENGASFRITSSGCSNPGNTISAKNAWDQVKLWQPKDSRGNEFSYAIINTKDYAPTGWKDTPPSVAMVSFNVSGNTATAVVRARASMEVQKHYEYSSGGTYQVDSRPYPSSIKGVYVNTTITTDTTVGDKTTRRIVTSNKESGYSYNSSTGRFSITYRPAKNEVINHVIGIYDYYDMGEISSGATCTFAFGAEVVDEHTFLVLPKANKKYKLTIDGVEYDDSQVKDSRGVIMPRGSAGYAMWAALKNTGWQLGICDVIAKGFDASIDYGVFNLESDMKDSLFNIQSIQELYGGILRWHSDLKRLDYRAENSEDYDSFDDGFNRWTGYEFREGKNIIDQPNITVDNNIITKAYILGYGNMNIKKVNGGKSYVTDYSYTTDTYEGYLEQPLIYDTNDDGGQKQLLYWGQKEIKKRARPRQTISYNVTDIRTVEGYEHEVFNIDDICRAYYRDSSTGKEVFEEKRIISWEYNVFAYWDCAVELGDKTQNLSELFRLVYNTAVENSPKPNASGKISSGEIVMEIDITQIPYTPDIPSTGDPGVPDIPGIPNYPVYDPEYPPSSYGYGGGGGGGITNITNYISLIAQKQTENTNAIAGLILQATDLYAQVDLFASYQSRTDELISETYSGLKLYADALSSSLELKVTGNYNDLVNKIQTSSKAAFEAIQNSEMAMTHQYSQLERRVYNNENGLSEAYQQYAGLVTRVEAGEKSEAELRTDFKKEIYDKNGLLQTTIQSFNSYKQEATATFAKTTDLTSYLKTDQFGKKLSESKAVIEKYASESDAFINLKTSVKTATTNSEAAVKIATNTNNAIISLKASVDNFSSIVKITQGQVLLHAKNAQNISYVAVSTSGVDIWSRNSVNISGSTYLRNVQGLTFQGTSVGWKKIQTVLYGGTNKIFLSVLAKA